MPAKKSQNKSRPLAPDPSQQSIDHHMMRLALDQASLAAAADEVPVGAVVYTGNRVLAQAHNLRETLNDPTAHAEILALRAAAQSLRSWRLENCSIAVTLEPCPMCAGALVNARVARLVYATADPKMGCVDSLAHLCTNPKFNHRLQVVPNLLADESSQLLKAFFKPKRRKK